MRDYPEDYTKANFKFSSKSTGSVPTAIAGGAFAVYKSSGTTQSTAGVTFTGSFDGITGANNITIDLSSDAFYEVGEDYQIMATAGTVDGVSVVGEIVGNFSIENQYMRGTDSALLASSAPTNFSALSITAGGLVSLASTGLDAIVSTATGMVQIAKAIWDRTITAGNHNIVNSAGRIVRELQIGSILHASDTQSGSTADIIVLANSADNSDNFYNNQLLIIDGEAAIILNYVGATRSATLHKTLVNGAPPNNTPYEISALGPVFSTAVGGSYSQDSVHISASGSTTAIVNRDGLNTTPIDDGSLSNARTVADAKNLTKYSLKPNAAIVLNANYDDWLFVGTGSSVDLNGQSVLGARFDQGLVQGASLAGVGLTVLRDLLILNTTFRNQTAGLGIELVGTLTLDSSANFQFTDFTTNNDTAVVAFTNSGARLELDKFSGNLNLQTMAVGNEAEVFGNGFVTINANCTGGSLTVGDGTEVIDLSGGAVTVTQGTIASIKTVVDSILTDTGTTLPATLSTIEGKVDTVGANVDSILVDTGTTIPAQISALNDITVNDVLTTQMTESYAADGTAPTLAQAVMLIQQTIGDFSISGTTITTKQLDGSTTAATYTLDDDTNPTSRTRAT